MNSRDKPRTTAERFAVLKERDELLAAKNAPTPRVDEAVVTRYVPFGGVGSRAQEMVHAGFARQLEQELDAAKAESRLDKMTARESADWFDALLIELSGLLGCGKEASGVIAAVKTCVAELASRDAEYMRGAKMLADNAKFASDILHPDNSNHPRHQRFP